MAAWEQAGRWDADAPGPILAVVEPVSTKPAITIQAATEAFLANRAGRDIARATLSKYKTFVKQLGEFADAKGYVMLDQIQLTGMDEFYGSWPDGPRAKGKKLERLKEFLVFCVKRKWIAENPASDLEAPVGAGAAANRMPFTDAELNRIDEACDSVPAVEWKNNLGSGVWTGDDVKTLVMLLCWTGLRISDAATFDMNRVTPHPPGGANVFLRARYSPGWMIGSTSACSRASASFVPGSSRPDDRRDSTRQPIFGGARSTRFLGTADRLSAPGPRPTFSATRL